MKERIFNPASELEVRAPLHFLGYTNTQVGDFLATGHYDRVVVTLAIAESALRTMHTVGLYFLRPWELKVKTWEECHMSQYP
jgi:hypothetical protein